MQEIGNRIGTFANKDHDCADALKVLKYIQYLWGETLNSRSEEVKGSMKGKLISATYSQTDSYLKPLYKLLGKNSCPDDIMQHLVIIVKYMVERDYVKVSFHFCRSVILML